MRDICPQATKQHPSHLKRNEQTIQERYEQPYRFRDPEVVSMVSNLLRSLHLIPRPSLVHF